MSRYLMITYYVYTYDCPKPARTRDRPTALSAIANHDPPATRNRDRARPRTKTILCRMHGCNHIESQLHIVKCKKLRPYWNLVARIQLHHHSPRRTIPPRTQSPPCASHHIQHENQRQSPPRTHLRSPAPRFRMLLRRLLANRPRHRTFIPTLVFHETLLSLRSPAVLGSH